LVRHELKLHSVRPEPVEGYETIYVSTSSTKRFHLLIEQGNLGIKLKIPQYIYALLIVGAVLPYRCALLI